VVVAVLGELVTVGVLVIADLGVVVIVVVCVLAVCNSVGGCGNVSNCSEDCDCGTVDCFCPCVGDIAPFLMQTSIHSWRCLCDDAANTRDSWVDFNRNVKSWSFR